MDEIYLQLARTVMSERRREAVAARRVTEARRGEADRRRAARTGPWWRSARTSRPAVVRAS
jgi:hypothetical protein